MYFQSSNPKNKNFFFFYLYFNILYAYLINREWKESKIDFVEESHFICYGVLPYIESYMIFRYEYLYI